MADPSLSRRRPRTWLPLILLLACCLPNLTFDAVAGEAGDSDQESSAEEEPSEVMVVTASRSEREVFESFRSIEVLSAEELIEIQAPATPQAVGQLTGVFLQQTNLGAGAPFLRGLVGPQNLILIDGVRFNNSTFRTGPNQYLALLPQFGLARLEVVRGPSAVLFGNGAMGGVIQAITLDPPVTSGPWNWQGAAQARAATADRSNGGAVHLSLGGHGFALSADLDLRAHAPMRTGGGRRLPLSDNGAIFWGTKAIWAPASAWTLKATYLGAAVLDAGRIDQLGLGDVRFYDNRDHLAYVTIRFAGAGFLKTLGLTASYHRLEEEIDRYRCDLAVSGDVADPAACLSLSAQAVNRRRVYIDEVDTLGAEANALMSFFDDHLEVHSGLEFYHDRVGSTLTQQSAGDQSEIRLRGNFSDGSRYGSLGAHLHAIAMVADLGADRGQIRINGGGRFSLFYAAADDVPGLGRVSFSHHGLVGSAGVQYLQPGLFNVYFSYLQGFRAPNLQETTVLGDTGSRFEVPNPDLGPERSHTFELGFRLLRKYMRLQAAYYYGLWDDAITMETTTWQGQTDVDGKRVHQLINGQGGVLQGLEFDLAFYWWRLSLFLDAAWTQGDVEFDTRTTPAQRIPPLFGSVGLRYDPPGRPFFASLFVRWADRQDRLHPSDLSDLRICGTSPASAGLRNPCRGTPGWFTFNLRAGWRPNDVFRLDLTLDNLTDLRYRMHGSGNDAPGFDLRLTATTRF